MCVEQYLCTHPKLDNMMYCLLEPFKDWPVLRHVKWLVIESVWCLFF